MKIFEIFNTGNKFESLGFDLVDDLAFYILNDQETYRKFIYPVEVKIKKMEKQGKSLSTLAFRDAVEAGFTKYSKKYKLSKIGDKLPDDILKSVCDELDKNLRNNKETF